MGLKLYNLNKAGGYEKIRNVKSAYTNNRTIIVQDDENSVLWLLIGKQSDPEIKRVSSYAIEAIKEEIGEEYEISEIDYDDYEMKVKEFLASNVVSPSTKTKSRTGKSASIPSVEVKVSGQDVRIPKGDMPGEGPVLEEFQIAYYEDEETSLLIQLEEGIDKQVVQTHIDKMNELYANKSDPLLAKEELTKSITTLVDKLFVKPAKKPKAKKKAVKKKAVKKTVAKVAKKKPAKKSVAKVEKKKPAKNKAVKKTTKKKVTKRKTKKKAKKS